MSILDNHFTETGTGCPLRIPAGTVAVCSVYGTGSSLELRKSPDGISGWVPVMQKNQAGAWPVSFDVDCVIVWACTSYVGAPVDVDIQLG